MTWKHFSQCWAFVRYAHRSPVYFPYKRTLTNYFHIFFVVSLSKMLTKQCICRWSETLWPSCDVTKMTCQDPPCSDVRAIFSLVAVSRQARDVLEHGQDAECKYNVHQNVGVLKYDRLKDWIIFVNSHWICDWYANVVILLNVPSLSAMELSFWQFPLQSVAELS